MEWHLTDCIEHSPYEKPAIIQLIEKFPAFFFGARSYITAFTSVRHLSLSWTRSIQSLSPPQTAWKSILILSLLRQVFQVVSFPQISPKPDIHLCYLPYVEPSWNVMAHDDAREGKWRGNWRMEWVASTRHTASEHGVSSITTITTADAHTTAASSHNWTDALADLNGLVRFAERRNLVSARVPSHFKRSLPHVLPISFSHTCHMLHPPHSSWFDHPNIVWWGVQFEKFLVV